MKLWDRSATPKEIGRYSTRGMQGEGDCIGISMATGRGETKEAELCPKLINYLLRQVEDYVAVHE